MYNENEDRIYINAGANVGSDDTRSININMKSEHHIGDWLQAFTEVLRAMGYSYIDEVVAYNRTGGEHTSEQPEFSF